MSATTDIPEDTQQALDKALKDPDLDNLGRLLSSSSRNVSKNSITKAILRHVTDRIPEAMERRGLGYVLGVAGTILGLSELTSNAFTTEYYGLLIQVARSCFENNAFMEAQDADLKLQHAPAAQLTSLRLTDRLESVTRLLIVSTSTNNQVVAELATAKGLPVYQLLCRQLHLTDDVTATTLILRRYLLALGNSLKSRSHFGDATKAFYDLYQSSSEEADLENAVLCTLLTETGPLRLGHLAALHLEPAISKLGDLGDILERAFHSQLLRPADSEILAKRDPSVSLEVITEAMHEHNIHVISNVYDNISFSALGQLLGSVSSTAAGKIVTKMVLEGRLTAVVNQLTQWISFRTHDSVSDLVEWDTKIAAICNDISHAASLLTTRYPELSRHLQ